MSLTELVQPQQLRIVVPPHAELGGSSLAQILGAWCIVLFRHFEREDLALELRGVYTHPSNGISNGKVHQPRTIRISLSGDTTSRELLLRINEALSEPTRDGSGTKDAFGFGDSAGQTALALLSPISSQGSYELCFDPARIAAPLANDIAERLTVTLSASIAQPDVRIDSLPLLTREHEEELVQAWTGPSAERSPLPPHRLFERQARERPSATAIAINSLQVSYAELNLRANRVAHWLREQGVGRGARVALCMDPCVEFVVHFLAVLKCGGTHVPVEPSYPIERQGIIVEETAPRLIVAHDAYQSRFASSGRPVYTPDYIERQAAGCSGDNLDAAVDGSDVVYIMYTSGTTGRPKGVMITHDNLAHFMRSVIATYALGPADTVPAMARFSFSITYFEVFAPLIAGAKLLLLERGHVLELRRVVEMLREVTFIHASPSLWRKVINYIDEQRFPLSDFHHLRHVSSGGDMVPPDILEGLKRLFQNAEVYVIYGCSEGACMSCSYEVPRNRTLSSTRVGKAFANAGIRLLDSEGNLVPPGMVGEVCFYGAGLAKGYLHLEELTREKFIDWRGERVYRTGDLGRVDEDGNLQLVGRSDFQIKLRGMRLEAAEIEVQLRLLAGVRDAVVTAPEMHDGERQLVAYVVSAPGAEPNARKWRDALKRVLPDYMVPAYYVALDALPVNANNKLDRKKLNTLAYEPLSFGEVVPPKTPQQAQLVNLWKRLLNVKELGIKDDFFELGGSSIRAVELMAEVDKLFKVALPVSVLLTDTTIEQLSLWLDAGDGPASQAPNRSEITLRAGTGERPAMFFVHDGDGESLPYRNLAMRLHPGHTVYGLQPKSTRLRPMLHTRIEDAVTYYVSRIRALQPDGPYFLSGLCVGGFLAFEIAKRLKSTGCEVGVVAVIDAAFVGTKHRSVAQRRAGRLRAALREATGGVLERAAFVVTEVARRGRNVIEHEARTRFSRLNKQATFKALRWFLDRELAVPDALPVLSVDAVLRAAEREYPDRRVYPGEILMFRATTHDHSLDGIVDDTPYQRLFEDPTLGWSDRAEKVHIFDIAGGHSSMLREPAVADIAAELQKRIDAALTRAK